MVIHETKIHGKCPINGSWDYYVLTIRTDGFVRCEDIESVCDKVRGSLMTQEDMANELRELIPSHCTMTLHGNHGQNVATVVEL